MKLFQFAVIWHPSDEQKKDNQKSKCIVDITTVVAPDLQGATLLAARQIPEAYLKELDQVEVAVRPF